MERVLLFAVVVNADGEPGHFELGRVRGDPLAQLLLGDGHDGSSSELRAFSSAGIW